jgi:hypothetical protein
MTNPSAKSLAPRVRSRKHWLGAAVGAVALLAGARDAFAQGWLADRRYTQGAGIRTGDVELHPGIGGEVGYDSNWYLRSNTEGPNIINGAPFRPVRDAAVFRITPSFYVSTLSGQRAEGAGNRFFQFRFGVSATARFFIGKELENQHNVSLSSDGRVDLNSGSPIAAGIYAAYSRLVQPSVQSDPNLSFTRDDVKAGAEMVLMPGGGTFDLRTGYEIDASLYEQSNGAPFNSILHQVFLKDRWKFRPRTAVFSEASLGWLNYPNASRSVFQLNDGTPLKTRAGITGLVTNWLGLTGAAGYGASFFKNGFRGSTSQYDSFTLQADATFYMGGNTGNDLPGEQTLLLSTINVGVARDFQRSLLGNFYISDRAYAKLVYWFGSRVLADVHIIGERLDYPEVFYNPAAIGSTPAFTNYRLIGGIFAEYRFSDQFGMNTTVDYTQQFSNTQLKAGSVPGSTAPGVFDQNYNRLQAFLGFRYFY